MNLKYLLIVRSDGRSGRGRGEGGFPYTSLYIVVTQPMSDLYSSIDHWWGWWGHWTWLIVSSKSVIWKFTSHLRLRDVKSLAKRYHQFCCIIVRSILIRKSHFKLMPSLRNYYDSGWWVSMTWRPAHPEHFWIVLLKPAMRLIKHLTANLIFTFFPMEASFSPHDNEESIKYDISVQPFDSQGKKLVE